MGKKKQYLEDQFVERHIGPNEDDIKWMLEKMGLESIEQLINFSVPKSIRSKEKLTIGSGISEKTLIEKLKIIAEKNVLMKSYIGMGYYNCITPPVIQRNILENPGWYTQYTPYQAEISQGRLEALINFQTMVCDFTALPISNASLLDEATAAAEAMIMVFRMSKNGNIFLVSNNCHPQTIDVLKTRSEPLGISIKIQNEDDFVFNHEVFGSIIQYPGTDGSVNNFQDITNAAHKESAYVIVATDLMSLALLKAPGELGADVAIGSSQRFGVPMGYGGPHAAFFAVTEKFKRFLPGRLIGVSKDSHGNQAYRMSLQTREQHIRREKATSNICTAQVLLAIMSGMYAVYHGPKGIKRIAETIHQYTSDLAISLSNAGFKILNSSFFDTIHFTGPDNTKEKLLNHNINIREFSDGTFGVSMDETVGIQDFKQLLSAFEIEHKENNTSNIPTDLQRDSLFLTHPVFNSYQSETEMLRYIHRLESKDLSLNTSMIPLGSCTMKLNATSEMIGITWPEFGALHPFVPLNQAQGYKHLFDDLCNWLGDITGLPGVSLQPNSGAQGEYAGLMVIRAFHLSKGDTNRTICLIPESAHGTNPASAIMCGMEVVVVKCDSNGNVDLNDLKNKASQYQNNLSALMITYPSTHGVFENTIQEICSIVHSYDGQVYMDGANLNAMVGICKPGHFGADVMHINLHKTFCIPHGGGGPGMGPICVNEKLTPFLPTHYTTNEEQLYSVSSSPYGSASILLISYIYMKLMGGKGLLNASQIAILNANYMAKRLEKDYTILYRGISGLNAHEFIIDCREFKNSANITNEDIAKRLIDYGYHAPTMSWPIPGTLMIEPTESESKDELDRFCDAMIQIKKEINDIADGKTSKEDNVLINAPHTIGEVCSEWNHPYSREEAVFAINWIKENKFWPYVSRIDNAYGDRNFFCVCPDIEDYK